MVKKETLNNMADEIWKSAERLRGKFKSYEYQNVILPIIVIRRIECVLIKMREVQAEKIKRSQKDISDKDLKALVKNLEISQFSFYNKTEWLLEKINQEDAVIAEQNLREYINNFSENIQEIINKLNYRETIGLMKSYGRISPILNQYSKLDLGPDNLSNHDMGYVYEELLKRFSEQSGEEAGQHFTPREVIRLMVELLDISVKDKHISIYDPACGTGGMLTIGKEHALNRIKDHTKREATEKLITLHGHEMDPKNYAVCKADMLIKDETEAHIFYGNSLIPHDPQKVDDPGDQLAGAHDKFHYMLSNPPFGVTWGGEDGYEKEVRKLEGSRYKAGLPRSNDGALLFLQTMLSKMKPPEDGGSKMAIIFNGSPLSNGDCGSGESEIRRWILENDWLDAIVMLPDEMFYNTSIFTYIWLLTNKKPAPHKNKVMIIDARGQYEKEPKSFGNKRNRMINQHLKWVEDCYAEGWGKEYKNEKVKIFQTTDFAFHKVSVVFHQTDENDQPMDITETFDVTLSTSNVKKKFDFFGDLLFDIKGKTDEGKEFHYKFEFNGNSPSFDTILVNLLKKDFPKLADIKASQVASKFRSWEFEAQYTHKHYIQDNEYIPFGEDIESFLTREIAKPIIKWEDSPQLGYEILPNKYFYKYEPPKPAEEILNEFWQLEKEAEEILKGLR